MSQETSSSLKTTPLIDIHKELQRQTGSFCRMEDAHSVPRGHQGASMCPRWCWHIRCQSYGRDRDPGPLCQEPNSKTDDQ